MTANIQYRPLGTLDANARLNQNSYKDQAYLADLGGGANKVYEGYARPGSSGSNTGWKIKKNTYDTMTGLLLTTKWPENPAGKASNDYQFIWANRATYVYI